MYLKIKFTKQYLCCTFVHCIMLLSGFYGYACLFCKFVILKAQYMAFKGIFWHTMELDIHMYVFSYIKSL